MNDNRMFTFVVAHFVGVDGTEYRHELYLREDLGIRHAKIWAIFAPSNYPGVPYNQEKLMRGLLTSLGVPEENISFEEKNTPSLEY